MDIGALLQCVAGEPQVANGPGMTGKTNPTGNWQSGGEMPLDHETISFVQAVRQILGQTDCQADNADDGRSTHPDPSGALSQMGLLIEMVGQGDTDRGQGNDPAPSSTEHEVPQPELLAVLNLALEKGQSALVGASEHTSTEIDTDLLAVLNEKISALENSPNGSAAAVSADTRKVVEQPLGSLKTDMGRDPEPTQAQPQQEKGQILRIATDADLTATRQPYNTDDAIVDNTTEGEKIAAKGQGQIAGMATHPSVDAQADTIVTAMASKNQVPPFMVPKKSANTSRSQHPGTESSVQATPVTEDGKISTATSPAQVLMPQREHPQSQQQPNQPPSMQTVEKAQDLEWAGLKKDSVKEGATVIARPQAAASSPKLDERLFVNEQKTMQHARQHQILENEHSKPTLSDPGRTEPDLNVSTTINMSDASSTSKTPLASMEPRPTLVQGSGDATFQKTVMDQIVEKATLRSLSDRSEMHIRLKPDVLGDVRMRVVTEKNQLIVQMVTEKSDAKEIIESQIHQLRAELDKQGLTVGKIEVAISAGNDQQDSRGQFFQMFKNNSEGRGKGQNSGDQPESAFKHQQHDDEETDSPTTGINYFV